MSIADTLEQLGLLEIVSRKNAWRSHIRAHGGKVANVEDVFAWEKFTWDILRKEERGFWILLEAIKDAMKEVIPSDVVMPEGTRSLIVMVRIHTRLVIVSLTHTYTGFLRTRILARRT